MLSKWRDSRCDTGALHAECLSDFTAIPSGYEEARNFHGNGVDDKPCVLLASDMSRQALDSL